MPELPEVEIVRESLNKKIRQKKVENQKWFQSGRLVVIIMLLVT